MPTAEKVDLFKTHKDEYVTPKRPVLVNVKASKYLAVSGQGIPGGALFQAQVGALYGVAYTVKMTRKFGRVQDFKIPPLEGLYWGPDTEKCLMEQGGEGMNWKLLIRMPAFVTQRDLKQAVATLTAKGKPGPFGEVKLEPLREGKCVQMLHLGPYDKELQTIGKMEAFAESRRMRFHGPHHEVYLNDPHKVAPAKLRTILRQPVIAVSRLKARAAAAAAAART